MPGRAGSQAGQVESCTAITGAHSRAQFTKREEGWGDHIAAAAT